MSVGDIVFGKPGVSGAITLVYGEVSTGKTSWALHLGTSAMERGDVGVFVDCCGDFNSSVFKTIGLKLDGLLVLQPRTLLQLKDLLEGVLGNDRCFIIVDSICRLMPEHPSDDDYRAHASIVDVIAKHVSRFHGNGIFISEIRYHKGKNTNRYFSYSTANSVIRSYADVICKFVSDRDGRIKLEVERNRFVPRKNIYCPMGALLR